MNSLARYAERMTRKDSARCETHDCRFVDVEKLSHFFGFHKSLIFGQIEKIRVDRSFFALGASRDLDSLVVNFKSKSEVLALGILPGLIARIDSFRVHYGDISQGMPRT